MYRIFLTLAMAGALSACGGGGGGGGGGGSNPTSNAPGVGSGSQPLVPDPDADPDTGSGSDPDPEPQPTLSSDRYGADVGVPDKAPMNDIQYDPTTDELILNNMTFDDKNPFDRDAAATASLRAAGSNFDAYRNAVTVDEYYAVFRRTDYTQVVAAGSRSEDFERPIDVGGIGVERLSGAGTLPAADATYVFTGDYAGVRTIYPDSRNPQEEIQYVTGAARITVDIEDYDETGSVRGVIDGRKIFDRTGLEMTATNNQGHTIGDATFIRLDPNTINFDNWSINAADAQLAHRHGDMAPTRNADGQLVGGDWDNDDGQWSGVFAGPNGEEVAGIVVLESSSNTQVSEWTPVGINAAGDYIYAPYREVGAFTAER